MIKQISFMENIYIGSSVNIVVLSKRRARGKEKQTLLVKKKVEGSTDKLTDQKDDYVDISKAASI